LFVIIPILLIYFGSNLLKAEEKQHPPGSVYLGFEFIELQQNRFRDLGKDNYTALLGFASDINENTSWGLHYTGMHVQLSQEHLLEPSPAYRGDFSNVIGTLNVQRVYLDYYYNWDFRSLSIRPVLSFGLGYNNWWFYNALVDADYDLKSFSAGFSGRFRFTLFNYVFAEIPAVDIFFHLSKNRSTEAFLGDAHIAFNEYFGLFNWIFFGIDIPF
jgi:hypothetical protein